MEAARLRIYNSNRNLVVTAIFKLKKEFMLPVHAHRPSVCLSITISSVRKSEAVHMGLVKFSCLPYKFFGTAIHKWLYALQYVTL